MDAGQVLSELAEVDKENSSPMRPDKSVRPILWGKDSLKEGEMPDGGIFCTIALLVWLCIADSFHASSRLASWVAGSPMQLVRPLAKQGSSESSEGLCSVTE